MSFLQELCEKRKNLKTSDTIVTLPDGRRFIQSKNEKKTIEIPQTYGFVVDTKPDNVPAKILENLYLGSQDCCELAVINKYGIKNVLSVGVEPTYKFPDINYKFVECLDLPETNLNLILRDCIPYVKLNVERNSNILVHCNAGVSRSSAIVIGFLILEKQMSYAQAFGIVKEARSCIKPNSGFDKQLRLLAPSRTPQK